MSDQSPTKPQQSQVVIMVDVKGNDETVKKNIDKMTAESEIVLRRYDSNNDLTLNGPDVTYIDRVLLDMLLEARAAIMALQDEIDLLRVRQ